MKYQSLLVIAIPATLFIASPADYAQTTTLSSHTWVSAEGNDTSGTGTRAAPFATFQKAVDETASGGEVSVVDPGNYGAVIIVEPVTIDGGGVRGSITFSGTNNQGVYVSTGVSGPVVLRNLDIDGGDSGGYPIYLYGTGTLVVEDCSVHGFTGSGIFVNMLGGSDNVSVTNTNVTGGSYGFYEFSGSGGTLHGSMRNCVLSQASEAGINVGGEGTLDISNSSIIQNYNGVECADSTVSAVGCMLSDNTGGAALAYGEGKIRLSNDSLFDNATGIGLEGGTVMTLHNNVSSGNTTPGEANANAATF